MPRVALVGAAGHGAKHLRRIAAAAEAGQLRLVGVCDIRPVPAPQPFFTDHRALFAATAPDVVVVATPPHTHLAIALDAVATGADLMLEKPPVLDLAEHDRLTAALRGAGRCCQIGFQALGSAALAQLLAAVEGGRLGMVTRIAAAAAWWRPDSYYTRAPWAGRRSLHGRPVLDGALANPFAHALMDCLVIAAAATRHARRAPGGSAQAGGRPDSALVERYAVRDIEVDDTANLRLRLPDGPSVRVAVSLASTTRIAGEITVYGTEASAVLEYPTDVLRLPADTPARVVPGRTDPLANLLAHRADPAVPLLAPLAAARPFTAVIQAVVAGPAPHRVASAHLAAQSDGPAIPGVAELVRAAAATDASFAKLGAAWAVPPLSLEVAGAQADPA
ncbi:MAG: Gfo/Idh/MocA family oxidoreductase [Micromonosporaceae bacterium]|nr:Gfo/Idh/MocA family oxidoreductase [Micromonosporaceae bacterium]